MMQTDDLLDAASLLPLNLLLQVINIFSHWLLPFLQNGWCAIAPRNV